MAGRAAEAAAALWTQPPDAPVTIPEGAHDAYIVQMLHRAREYDARRSPLRAALEAHLVERHANAEDIVRAEHQRQAASQASVANAITSLRLCTTIDWRQYVESVSLVDNVLRRDPAGIYAQMDFLSRDRQRRVVESLAPTSGTEQVDVALAAIELARHALVDHAAGDRETHVGYYLVDHGRTPLEAALLGARELAGPIIAMTITLAAVYTPIALQGGLTGSLFREFAFTLAGAVLISGVVALTLSPMMSAKLLRANASEAWFPRQINRVFDAISVPLDDVSAVMVTMPQPSNMTS